ncbi:PREDICTED: cardioactive peptide isoform X2 [Dinoponera quadriceps]|uniref:Cardioactive peptide isoform X2 n=1 Tax=Dinoponera quadriceps TaxID=609295 RepID=A0A6P3YHI3_DINQU|nr:PREDICTED: cardioactive peptide isoform X2 [Dinoponera quadriceps]
MKVTEYLCCALACMCLLKVANTEISRDKFERQLLDALTTERTMKTKRPFCNAFTGCGRKRSFPVSTPTLRDPQDFRASDNVRLPVTLYRALLNAAKQNTWDALDREEYDYRLQRVPQQVYLPGQTALRDTLES